MPVIPKNYADLLETKALAHVATLGPKGEPQNTPVWFGWDGNHVLLTMTKTAQKYLNLQRDPRLALSIVDPKNSYRYLVVHSLNTHYFDFEGELLGATRWLMTTSPPPNKGMLVGIP